MKSMSSNTRLNREPMDEALRNAEAALNIIKTIVGGGGEHPNYYVAKALIGVGEVYVEKKELEEAEKYVHKA